MLNRITTDEFLTSSRNIGNTDVISRFFVEQIKKENEIFEKALRENAEPKVTGEITKGKIRWRGIRIVQQNDFLKSVKWLEQRGKQISPKITFEASANGL
jgi:curli biogenesis system outer membrane secretion channel CsgG